MLGPSLQRIPNGYFDSVVLSRQWGLGGGWEGVYMCCILSSSGILIFVVDIRCWKLQWNFHQQQVTRPRGSGERAIWAQIRWHRSEFQSYSSSLARHSPPNRNSQSILWAMSTRQSRGRTCRTTPDEHAQHGPQNWTASHFHSHKKLEWRHLRCSHRVSVVSGVMGNGSMRSLGKNVAWHLTTFWVSCRESYRRFTNRGPNCTLPVGRWTTYMRFLRDRR